MLWQCLRWSRTEGTPTSFFLVGKWGSWYQQGSKGDKPVEVLERYLWAYSTHDHLKLQWDGFTETTQQIWQGNKINWFWKTVNNSEDDCVTGVRGINPYPLGLKQVKWHVRSWNAIKASGCPRVTVRRVGGESSCHVTVVKRLKLANPNNRCFRLVGVGHSVMAFTLVSRWLRKTAET